MSLCLILNQYPTSNINHYFSNTSEGSFGHRLRKVRFDENLWLCNWLFGTRHTTQFNIFSVGGKIESITDAHQNKGVAYETLTNNIMFLVARLHASIDKSWSDISNMNQILTSTSSVYIQGLSPKNLYWSVREEMLYAVDRYIQIYRGAWAFFFSLIDNLKALGIFDSDESYWIKNDDAKAVFEKVTSTTFVYSILIYLFCIDFHMYIIYIWAHVYMYRNMLLYVLSLTCACLCCVLVYCVYVVSAYVIHFISWTTQWMI